MFKKAIPVFAKGEENSLNYPLTLCAEIESLKYTKLFIGAFSFYRLYINGKFVCAGPARAAKGYARIDEIDADKYNVNGKNTIELQIAGYNCGSISTARQSSFVVCELRRGEDTLLYTGRDFEGYFDFRRVQKVERYSFQRHFGEIWRVNDKDFRELSQKVELVAATNTPKYLPRRVPTPKFDFLPAEAYASLGEFFFDEELSYKNNRYSIPVSGKWGMFDENEIDSKPFRWIQRQSKTKREGEGRFPIILREGEYVTVDMERIECGYICLSGKALSSADVVVGFSELCDPSDFQFTNINCQNVIEYFVEDGVEFSEQSFEPYTCRIAIIMARGGEVRIDGFSIRRYEFDRSRFIKREIKDAELARIGAAAEATFAHNAVDIYMDCPSRERSGWLCDSYFTARAEHFLTGESLVEDVFLENYALYESDGSYPDGALPMCYPSDEHDNNKFIPQWCMWYVLEVKEYLTERNTSADKEMFKKSVCGVVKFLENYENADGLLQNLPSWNFVEWSDANSWVQDVNYPTNFLYAEVLRAAGSLYDRADWADKAERVAKKTCELSFDGEVFIDNAVVAEYGRFVNTKNSSEAGQYYAILFGGIDINSPKYVRLKKHILENFKNFNTEGRGFVCVNAFIGFYLKMLALMKMGEHELLSRFIKDFFGGMVESTGSLWEYTQRKGSHDHGFASYAAVVIDFIENQQTLKKVLTKG